MIKLLKKCICYEKGAPQRFKRFSAFLLVFVILTTLSTPAFAVNGNTNSVASCIDSLINNCPGFSDWADGEITLKYSCLDDCNQASMEIYHIENEDAYLGYFVYDNQNGEIVEFGRGVDAFSIVMERLEITESATMYYKGFINEIVTEDMHIYFDEFGNLSIENSTEDERTYGTYSILPDADPQLQGSRNCIVAAVGNLIYYWWQNKSLTLSPLVSSYSGICARVDAFMQGYGGYANVNISRTIMDFVNQYAVNATASNNYTWSPEFWTVRTEINAGRPCLVGFRYGSSYSATVGHMTCCVGYEISGETNYLVLADGWSSNLVYKEWDDEINDFVFMCNIRMSGGDLYD